MKEGNVQGFCRCKMLTETRRELDVIITLQPQDSFVHYSQNAVVRPQAKPLALEMEKKSQI